MTEAQKSALIWLSRHNGEGTILKDQTLLAAGEIAPFMRATFNRLRDAGFIEIQRATRRIKLTTEGRQAATSIGEIECLYQ